MSVTSSLQSGVGAALTQALPLTRCRVAGANPSNKQCGASPPFSTVQVDMSSRVSAVKLSAPDVTLSENSTTKLLCVTFDKVSPAGAFEERKTQTDLVIHFSPAHTKFVCSWEHLFVLNSACVTFVDNVIL